MGISAEGQVGPRPVGDGSNTELRLARSGAAVISDGHGRLYEAVSRGKMFSASTVATGTTVATNNVSPLAAGVVSVLTIYNPQNSGVIAVLQKTLVGNVSGTPGAGNAWAYDVAFSQSIAQSVVMNNNGTAGAAPTCTLISGLQGSVQAFTQVVLTGATISTMFRVLGHTAFATALAATTPNMVYVENNDGDIILPPGAMLTLSPIALGTSHVVYASLTWEEVPV